MVELGNEEGKDLRLWHTTGDMAEDADLGRTVPLHGLLNPFSP